MKLSVCIPIYNFDVTKLVSDLRSEINASQLSVELILIDDGSNIEFKKLNQKISTLVEQFVFLEKNIGRSAIRNHFVKIAQGEFLLFLDNDAQIIDNHFLTRYLKTLNQEPAVDLIYGNFQIDQKYKNSLRNRYSLAREIAKPNQPTHISQFKTINFAINKDIFQNNAFDENIKNYGYEDFLFAKKLEEKKVRYRMIDNPVIHSDQATNAEFIAKTETGLQTLKLLTNDIETKKYVQDIKIVRAYQLLLKTKMTGLFKGIYSIFSRQIQHNLLSESPNLYLFDLMKLYYFIKIK